MEWASTKMCRGLLMEVVSNAVVLVENEHLSKMVADVIDEAWKRVEVNRIVKEVTDGDGEIWRRVERILSSRRAEVMELLANAEIAEAKQRRLERILVIKKILYKKLEAKNLRKMLRMIEKLSLEDLEMEVDEIEMKAIEMMEVEVDSGDNEEVENILEEYDVEMCQLDSDDDNMDYKNEVYKDIEVGREDVSPPCLVHVQRERFRDISTMLAFWERQECEEKTPVQ